SGNRFSGGRADGVPVACLIGRSTPGTQVISGRPNTPAHLRTSRLTRCTNRPLSKGRGPRLTANRDSNSSDQWSSTGERRQRVPLARHTPTWDMSGLKAAGVVGTFDPSVARLNGMAIPIQVVFDCADPPVVARFWADALGYQLQGPPEPTA